MSSYFGIGTDSSFFNNFFGGTSSTSGATSSSNVLGDYALIKSGSYKKLLKQYYAETAKSEKGNSFSASTSAAADSTKNLLAIKTNAKDVKEKAKALSEVDFETVDREKLLKDVKSFVESYNAVLEDTENIESVTVLQNAIWMKNQTEANDGLLSKAGITIGEGNELKIDETKFKEASASDLKTLFAGRNSVTSSIAQRASQIYNLAGTQAILNAKTGSYTSNGGYNVLTSDSLINSLM